MTTDIGVIFSNMTPSLALKNIIRQVLLEAPIDVWAKTHNPTPEQAIKAKEYFNDLGAKYNAQLHQNVKN